ncbi:MAG: SatD family protein [Peptococcaceae bacterium]
MGQIYCALIGDIVKSRKLQNRNEVQLKFENTLAELNKAYADILASNFTITLGDEFQGLITKPYLSFEIINLIKQKMKPVNLVFGIGVGGISTNINKSLSIGADGPAYHHARKMVEKAKSHKPSICFCSNSPEDELINSLLYFIETTEKSRTKRQDLIVGLYEQYHSQYKVAEQLAVEQSTISKTLTNAFYDQIKSSQQQIIDFLKRKYHHGEHL